MQVKGLECATFSAYHDMASGTSGHKTVRPLQRLSERTSFSLNCPPILQLLRPSQTPQGLLTQIKTSLQTNNTKLNKMLA
jgi:hypothetical protein